MFKYVYVVTFVLLFALLIYAVFTAAGTAEQIKDVNQKVQKIEVSLDKTYTSIHDIGKVVIKDDLEKEFCWKIEMVTYGFVDSAETQWAPLGSIPGKICAKGGLTIEYEEGTVEIWSPDRDDLN